MTLTTTTLHPVEVAHEQLPVLLSAGAVLDWVASTKPVLSADNILTFFSRVGRNDSPSLLAGLYKLGGLDSRNAVVVGDAWNGPDYPEDELPQSVWMSLFEISGYTIDGSAAQRPNSSLTLFRGSPFGARRNWSWTSDLEVAQAFAAGRFGRASGSLWTAKVAPWRLYCHNNDRDEHEYVVNTHGLRIA